MQSKEQQVLELSKKSSVQLVTFEEETGKVILLDGSAAKTVEGGKEIR